MSGQYAFRWLVVVAVGAGLAVAGWALLRDREEGSGPAAPPPAAGDAWMRDVDAFPRPPAGPPDPRSILFREAAADAGLTWRMSFLPGEQGETFKINLYDHGSGVAVADFDGDGRDDIYFCNQLGPNALYRNKGDGTFEDVAARAGVAMGDRVCVAATFADYDNDGRPDLFVTSTRGGNVLFRNLGGERFEDVTAKAGVGHVGHSQSAVFFDYDGDGHLDLFVTNTAEWTAEQSDARTGRFPGKGEIGQEGLSPNAVILSKKESNILYRNNGNGTFADVTERAGLKGRGWAGDAVAFDYDGDGRPDLFVTCMFGRAQLYRNNGNGTFADVTLEVLGRTPFGGVGAKAFDSDNDGRLDLLAVDMHSDMWTGADFTRSTREPAILFEHRRFEYMSGPKGLNYPPLMEKERELGKLVGFKHEEVIFGNAFYRQGAGGKYEETSDRAGLETFWPWGVATGDFDNDGHEDAFIPSGMGYPFYYWPNALMMNKGDGTFADKAVPAGIEPPARGMYLPEKILGRTAARSSRAAAVADFDGDGRLEVVVNNFNDTPYYFRNQAPRRNFVALRLRGTRSNRDAVGAVVRLHRGGKVLTRQVHGACGYLAQSSRTLHFGLADDATIDRVEITWPSGTRQQLTGLTPNALHEVVEPADAGGKK